MSITYDSNKGEGRTCQLERQPRLELRRRAYAAPQYGSRFRPLTVQRLVPLAVRRHRPACRSRRHSTCERKSHKLKHAEFSFVLFPSDADGRFTDGKQEEAAAAQSKLPALFAQLAQVGLSPCLTKQPARACAKPRGCGSTVGLCTYLAAGNRDSTRLDAVPSLHAHIPGS